MHADTVSEPLSAVIPGHDEPPSNEDGDEAAFVACYEAAIELATPGADRAGDRRHRERRLVTGAGHRQALAGRVTAFVRV
ncbi:MULTISPECIES: hypothetical protein [Streptomyces violaceusniger group]|uniref:Uncharacterized protein n=2 Tax=Streptomyces rhizosphaericus TaxID=114699 RepID=A0ABN1RLB3_9ACTN|nr:MULTISPECIES: hypothetical protein [Streptomyces violaceusniger group]